MQETTNLRLNLLEGSSVVDYNEINAYVTAIDKLAVEFVREKGTSGNYWYRKWSSGRAECGVDNREFYKSLDLRTQYGGTGLYIPSGRLNPFGQYPIHFLSRPYASVCFNYCNESASCVVIQSQTAGQTNAPSFVIANSGPVTLTSVQLSIFCTGRVSD